MAGYAKGFSNVFSGLYEASKVGGKPAEKPSGNLLTPAKTQIG